MAPDFKNMVNSISTANIFGEGTMLPCTWEKKAQTETVAPSYPPPPPGRLQDLAFDIWEGLSIFQVSLAKNGSGFQKYGEFNQHGQHIRKGHSVAVHMEKGAPQTETVAPSYPPPPPRHFQNLLFDTRSILRQFKQLPTVGFEPAHTYL